MNKQFTLGLILGCFAVGCISATFNYSYYYPDGTGALIGHTPKDDLPASTCNKNPDGSHTCVVMRKADFEMMVQDYLDTQNQLVKCERKCN